MGWVSAHWSRHWAFRQAVLDQITVSVFISEMSGSFLQTAQSLWHCVMTGTRGARTAIWAQFQKSTQPFPGLGTELICRILISHRKWVLHGTRSGMARPQYAEALAFTMKTLFITMFSLIGLCG